MATKEYCAKMKGQRHLSLFINRTIEISRLFYRSVKCKPDGVSLFWRERFGAWRVPRSGFFYATCSFWLLLGGARKDLLQYPDHLLVEMIDAEQPKTHILLAMTSRREMTWREVWPWLVYVCGLGIKPLFGMDFSGLDEIFASHSRKTFLARRKTSQSMYRPVGESVVRYP
jgi:hypothetical protein